MAEDEELCSMLVELAKDQALDLPRQSLLDHLAAGVGEVLPGVGAAITLLASGEGPALLAASDLETLRLERLQSEIGEGPSVTAQQTMQGVAVPDLGADDRFSVFAPRAVAAGTRGAFSWPLCHEGRCIGSLDLYRDTTGPLPPADALRARALAEVATSYLVSARSRDELVAERDHFQHDAQLLASRIREAFAEPVRLEECDLPPVVHADDRDPSDLVVIDLRTTRSASTSPDLERAPVARSVCEDTDEPRSLVHVGPVSLATAVWVEAPPLSDDARAALADVRTTMCEGIVFTRQNPRGARAVKQIHVELTGQEATLRDLKELMADQARDVGAQAVVNFRYGHHAPTWWRRQVEHGNAPGSWYGEGEAARWE